MDIIGLPATEGQDEPQYPQIDLVETPGEMLVEADLPGVKMKDLTIRYLDGTVIIEGRKRAPQKREIRYLCMERTFDRFQRSVRIPVPVHAGTARATLQGGVLTVRFEKVKEKRGRPIPIHLDPGGSDET